MEGARAQGGIMTITASHFQVLKETMLYLLVASGSEATKEDVELWVQAHMPSPWQLKKKTPYVCQDMPECRHWLFAY